MAKHTVVAAAICVALLQVLLPSNAEDTILLCVAAGKYLMYFPTPINLLLPIGHSSSTSNVLVHTDTDGLYIQQQQGGQRKLKVTDVDTLTVGMVNTNNPLKFTTIHDQYHHTSMRATINGNYYYLKATTAGVGLVDHKTYLSLFNNREQNPVAYKEILFRLHGPNYIRLTM